MNNSVSSAVFLQARLGSTRLPHKILLDLGGSTVLEQCMERLSRVETDLHVVLTDKSSFPIIDKICRTHPGWECFSGPAEDVLARYVFASRHYGIQSIVRATADNPLVSYELANLLLDEQQTDRADYRGHTGMPYGAGVEVVQAAALETAFIESMNPSDHEHVCPYLYNNPDKFRIVHNPAPEAFQQSDLRLTLDTPEDYHFLQHLFFNHSLEKTPPLSLLLKNLYSMAV